MEKTKKAEFFKNMKFHRVLAGIIFVMTLFLGIGYAQISGIDLSIEGSALAMRQTGLVITNVQYVGNNGAIPAESKINSYYQTMLDSKMKLGNTLDSSITYQITITNTTNENWVFDEVLYSQEFYDNEDIVFELTNLQPDDVINAHDSKTFQITFKYKDDLASITDTDLNSTLNFKFVQFVPETYTITFNANGGYFPESSNTVNTVTYSGGSIVSGEYIEPRYEEGSFRRWYTTEACTEGTEFYVDSYLGGDITVYAKHGIDRATFNIRSLYRQLHDGSMPDGTRYKNAIVSLKRANELPDWMQNKNWWSLNNAKVVGEYHWLYGNNGSNGYDLPIAFWMDQQTKTLYWYSEDASPILTYTDQYGSTILFADFLNAEDLSGASFWDMSQLESLDGMCNNCKKLTNLDFLRYWDVSNITSMKIAFSGMDALEDVSGISGWDVSNVTEFTSAFEGDTLITSESANTLNNWQLQSTATFTKMFRNVSNKPTFMFDVNGTPTAGTWDSNGTLVVPTA